MALIDADIKLLLINIHKTLFTVKGFDVPTVIPFPLELDINNFSLYSELDKLPGVKNFINVGNVVSGVQQTLTINSTQKSAAPPPTNPTASVASSTGMPVNDNTTGNQSATTQEPTGSQLQLEVTFEPNSKLPLLLGGYLSAAANAVGHYTFSYVSNELVAFDLLLGTFVMNYSQENTVISINFIQPLENTKASKNVTPTSKNATEPLYKK